MRKLALLTLLAGMLLVSMHASPAHAQLLHTWVASTGSDFANCGDRPTPCGTFTAAYANTAVGGEITCADSSNYSATATITHSITINCENAIGSSTTPGGTAVFRFNISTTNTTDVVTLRGLDLDLLGLGNNLLTFSGVGTLHLKNVKINNAHTSFSAIQFSPTGPAKLFVTDSDITNVGNSGTAAGIYIKPGAGVQANVMIERTRIENNFFGIVADGTGGGSIRGVVRDSVVSGNVNNGITVASSGAGAAVLSVENTSVSGNNFGLAASGTNAGMLVGQSRIMLNNTGLFTTGGGVLLSYKNNSVNGNTTTDGAFTGPVGQQ